MGCGHPVLGLWSGRIRHPNGLAAWGTPVRSRVVTQASNIKAEIHDVAFLHEVVLAFETRQSLFFRCGV